MEPSQKLIVCEKIVNFEGKTYYLFKKELILFQILVV